LCGMNRKSVLLNVYRSKSMAELPGSKRVVLVSTVPYFMVTQLGTQIRYLLEQGVRVTVVTSPGRELDQLQSHEALTVIPLQIPRKLDLWQDLKALIRLYHLFKSQPFDLLHSTTPKAGLLCAIAARLAGVPARLHTFTGQPWVTRQGVMRKVMRWSDMLVVKLMTHCYADSPSQREFLVEQGIALKGEISVIGCGSLGGVDVHRFSMARWTLDKKQELRAQLGIADADIVIIYIGRITEDKGIGELLEAFSVFQQQSDDAHLLLLGPTDNDGIELSERAMHQQHVHCLGYQTEPEKFLAVSDMLCLPSYREGFGTVVIEAAAMGVPAIGTRIPGLVDAIEDGVSGLLIPPRDVVRLQKAITMLARDSGLRERMGHQAYKRARTFFAADVLGAKLLSAYATWWGHS